MINFKTLIHRLSTELEYYKQVLNKYEGLNNISKNDEILINKINRAIPTLEYAIGSLKRVEYQSAEIEDFEEITDYYIDIWHSNPRREPLTKTDIRNFLMKGDIKYANYDKYNHETIEVKWISDYLKEQINKYLDKRFGEGEIIND